MRVCPYSNQFFSTKQRLVSHLTKNKKCYDVEKIGVPPILLEIMGFNTGHKLAVNPVESSSNCPSTEAFKSDNTNIEFSSTTETDFRKTPKTTEFQCSGWRRYFINQGNLNRHIVTNKCPKIKGKPIMNQSGISCDMLSITNYKSNGGNQKSEQSMQFSGMVAIENTDSDMYLPKNIRKSGLSLNRNNRFTRKIIEPEKHDLNKAKICTLKPNIKYIVKEDYIAYLTDKFNCRVNAMNFIKSCMHGNLRCVVNLLHKIYFEKHDSDNYPIEVLDAKGKKLYYKTPDNIIFDENGTHIKSVLVENLQNCYLKFCNHIIGCNLENNDVLFNDYDLNDIQKHLLELSDEKTKDKLLLCLIERIKE